MKMRTCWFTVAVLLIGLYPPAASWGAETVSITGQVVDCLARPVEGAEVAVCERIDRDDEDTAEVIAPIARTDRDGRFAVQANPTQAWRVHVVARKPGLALAWDGPNYSRNRLDRMHFLLVLERPCTLTGVVTDKQGRPVSGAAVQAVPKTSHMQRLSQRPVFGPRKWFTITTGDDGVFRFPALAADVTSDFQVKAPRLACTYQFTTHLISYCGYEVGREDIRLILPEESPVHGRVVNAGTGEPVAGIALTVKADRERGDVRDCYVPLTVTTDAASAFTCPGLPEGKNKIALASTENQTASWVARSVTVEVIHGQPTEEIQVSVEKGQILECAVREGTTGQPLSQVRVVAHNDAGTWTCMTDDKGVARVRVLPGECGLYVDKQGYTYWRSSERVTVAEDQAAHMDVLLDKHPSLGGIVVRPGGEPAEDALVSVHASFDAVRTDHAGRFSAVYEGQLADEGLFVLARDTERALAGFTVTKEFDVPVRVSLSPALIVRGRVADPNGIGIPAARVAFLMRVLRCACGVGEEVLTDSEGRFEYRALPRPQEPFEYRIDVHVGGYAPKTFDRISFDGELGTTVDLEPIQLRPANLSVSGVVVDAHGAPAPRAAIFLHGRDGMDQPDKATATDEQGRFAVTRIGQGPIRLQAGFDSGPNGSGTLNAEAGDHDLRIVLGQELVHERYESLLGQVLPDFSDLEIDAETVKTEGQAVLICFFDMQQRPSRHVVARLSKRAGSRADKGMVVIFVEVSGIERTRLDRWITDGKIPYPVGAVGGDIQQTRRRWGVKSLPWLVLTDANHVVRVEGADLSDVDGRLEDD